jgi:hypothetical protein
LRRPNDQVSGANLRQTVSRLMKLFVFHTLVLQLGCLTRSFDVDTGYKAPRNEIPIANSVFSGSENVMAISGIKAPS